VSVRSSDSKPPEPEIHSGDSVKAVCNQLACSINESVQLPKLSIETNDSEEVLIEDSPMSPQIVKKPSRPRLSSISTSKSNVLVTPLGSNNVQSRQNGYKSWAARPGTLVCNMLVAAGIKLITRLRSCSYNGFT
jgi:hypothetical protein